MKFKLFISKNLIRSFRAFDRQSFIAKNTERIKALEEINNNDKEVLIKRLTPEQKEYVDTIYETYFVYMPKHLQDKFYMYCLNEELKVEAPETVLFDVSGLDAKDLELIQNPVEDFYATNKEFNKLMAESTKNIDMSKLSQQSAEKPVEEAPQVVEQEDLSKKRFKVDVVGIDAAKKLNIIKEVKAMLNIGLKEVNL